jgi:hypothetical protein
LEGLAMACYNATDGRVATCSFCSLRLPLGEAMEAGWEPGYYEDATGDAYQPEPVCVACTTAHLAFDVNGEAYMSLPPW